MALAELYEQKRDFDHAFEQLSKALEAHSSNPLLLERLGDLESLRGNPSAASDAYRRALAGVIDRETRKRVRSKVSRLKP
jgi:predicted negative regulator of RcsB-dependent stress response